MLLCLFVCFIIYFTSSSFLPSSPSSFCWCLRPPPPLSLFIHLPVNSVHPTQKRNLGGESATSPPPLPPSKIIKQKKEEKQHSAFFPYFSLRINFSRIFNENGRKRNNNQRKRHKITSPIIYYDFIPAICPNPHAHTHTHILSLSLLTFGCNKPLSPLLKTQLRFLIPARLVFLRSAIASGTHPHTRAHTHTHTQQQEPRLFFLCPARRKCVF